MKNPLFRVQFVDVCSGTLYRLNTHGYAVACARAFKVIYVQERGYCWPEGYTS